jgi:hypothetical protein
MTIHPGGLITETTPRSAIDSWGRSSEPALPPPSGTYEEIAERSRDLRREIATRTAGQT